ncbi:MAG: hypothetical protein Q9226_007900, partial [Calogaya cf. arnoldii]
DLRRRLKDERREKSNFEDLLTALRDEIEQLRNEKDNLREEIVPQLQARIDGLESEALGSQKLVYDHTRMQQELEIARNENTALTNARKPQAEMPPQSSGFTSIAEEDGPVAMGTGPRVGLTRSNSTARSTGMMGGNLSRAGSLTRSNTVLTKDRESRESLADRVKDIEMQRDALHRALKSLLERQNYQEREHTKKIRALEAERDRALEAESPRRLGFEKEVTGLRFEINQLRRRADDALVQKWQCEKGLGGLKMDLDRAEQETSSLRTLLQEHDILVPALPGRSSQDGQPASDSQPGAHATSATLERAYKELQATQALSIDKLRELWGETPTSGEDAETAQRMETLLKTVNDAEAERDYAQKQAQIYRAKIESLQESENFYSGESAGLTDELKASAKRSERLATQVQLQLRSNGSLRERLAEAVGKGEAAQKSSADRINNMQAKLKALEDKLMNAQQHSEEEFAQHEEEVRQMREGHNMQLQRLKGGLKTPTFYSPKTSPMSPLFSVRSPRLDKTTSGQGMSMNEALRTQSLERRVAELEGALGDADKEMEEVVSRMNLAQIEVMELQSARDEAMRQTRKLQAAIVAEREKALAELALVLNPGLDLFIEDYKMQRLLKYPISNFTAKMEYLVRFLQVHESFRKAELEAMADLYGINMEFLHYNQYSPHCVIRLPDEDAARIIIGRSILSKGIYELWGSASTYAELHEDVERRTSNLWHLYKFSSFKFEIQAYQAKRSLAEQDDLIQTFRYTGFEGPIQLKDPEQTFCIFEQCEDGVQEPTQVYLGRLIAASSRPILDTYTLKKRKYLSTTSMDSELALVTANLTQAGPGKLFYDPFTGTGSFSIACAHFGAVSMGSDIDGRAVRGKNGVNILTSFQQYNLLDKYLDSFIADLTHTPLRSARILDGIICDPPYGVREGLKVLGSKDGGKKEIHWIDGKAAHLQDHYIPPKKPYGFEAMLCDILEFAAVYLVDGGRLSLWMPTANDEEVELEIPMHPCLEVVSVCVQAFNKWSRRLLTYRRLRDEDVKEGSLTRYTKKEEGSTANDLNSFRKRYFEGFKEPPLTTTKDV